VLTNFENHIEKNFPFLREGKLLIAVSGGLDSVALVHLCHSLNLNVALAHCNFNLRGDESDADENFVLQLAEDFNIEVFVENFDTESFAKDHKLSTQMAARALRYTWFIELAAQLQFEYILTAHHADDNLETFLINLSRGTGLEGLKGIPEINDNIVRPLLPFSREAIEKYAEENNIDWRKDSSNASDKYFRNALRHKVVTQLKDLNPQFLENFNKTISHIKDAYDVVNDMIDEVGKAILFKKENAVYFDIKKLQDFNNPKAYLYELLKGYGFTEWNDVYGLLQSQSGKQVFSEHWRLLKDRDHLILSEIGDATNATILIVETDRKVTTPFGQLQFELVSDIQAIDNNTIYIDNNKSSFPLKIRKWKKGDSFYPFGMQGSKKLSKYFKDEKMSLLDKENIWLLCLENDIVWVIGWRADERFKVTETTKAILKITLS